MCQLRQTRTRSLCALIFLAFVASSTGSAFAQQGIMPENAAAKSYGDGWNCNSGRSEERRVGKEC